MNNKIEIGQESTKNFNDTMEKAAKVLLETDAFKQQDISKLANLMKKSLKTQRAKDLNTENKRHKNKMKNIKLKGELNDN